MITNVYIDGFNLYFRGLRNTGYKWLNLRALAEALLPSDEINWLHYFTAKISPRPDDPSQVHRQKIYLDAIGTLPKLKIHYGVFRVREKSGVLMKPAPTRPGEIGKIEAPEEKRTDVNLATQLLIDAFTGDFEQALIITNDSDQVTPIRYVRDKLMLRVVVASPDRRRRAHRDLQKAASRVITIRAHHLSRSQFPQAVAVPGGLSAIRKPPEW